MIAIPNIAFLSLCKQISQMALFYKHIVNLNMLLYLKMTYFVDLFIIFGT